MASTAALNLRPICIPGFRPIFMRRKDIGVIPMSFLQVKVLQKPLRTQAIKRDIVWETKAKKIINQQ